MPTSIMLEGEFSSENKHSESSVTLAMPGFPSLTWTWYLFSIWRQDVGVWLTHPNSLENWCRKNKVRRRRGATYYNNKPFTPQRAFWVRPLWRFSGFLKQMSINFFSYTSLHKPFGFFVLPRDIWIFIVPTQVYGIPHSSLYFMQAT